MNAVNLNAPSWALVYITAPLVLITIGLVILSVMRYMQKPEKVIKKFEWLRTFYVWIGALAVLGGAWAFLFPLAITANFGKDGDGAALRQMLIYTTGGVLGVITLGENHRKNSLEKAKNDQDHTRQVHAERRSRYTKAIEHLFNENISVRLGGVYTLAGLADEWLSDEKTLPNEEERRKETQNIINNLCAYIRSSFDLVSKTEVLYMDKAPKNYEGGIQQFTKDQARFRKEIELRLAILEAIKTRLNDGITTQEDGTKKLLKGLWSDFNYDFSNAIFFYPANFSNSLFGAFSNFSGAKFDEYAEFSRAEFTGKADFSGAKFTEAIFSEAKFTEAKFTEAAFTYYAIFFGAKFTHYAIFSGVKFTNHASFSKVKFTQGADFSWATFNRYTHFSGAEFTGKADFSRAKFDEKPIFEYALDSEIYKARFSYKADPEDYNFKVSDNSRYKIETEEKEYNGTKFIIPKDAELFDPDEPSEQGNNDDS